MIRDHFTLRSFPLAEEVTRDGAADEMVESEISQPHLQVEDAISHGDESVATEHYGGSSSGGFCELGKENTCHAGLHRVELNRRIKFILVILTDMITPTIL